MIPEQCMAVIKPPGITQAHRCPVPAIPREFYCPFIWSSVEDSWNGLKDIESC